jgi:hypothetical protein
MTSYPTRPLRYLVKFCREQQHAEALIHRGDLFFRPVADFRLQESTNQFDLLEGALSMEQVPWMRLVAEDDGETFIFSRKDFPGDRTGHIDLVNARVHSHPSEPEGLLWCCMGLGPGEHIVLRDESARLVTDFGGFAVVFTDVNAFVDWVTAGLRRVGMNPEISWVTYYDEHQHSGNLSVFNKRMKYAYQREVRIFLPGPFTEPKVFRMGSFHNIVAALKVA